MRRLDLTIGHAEAAGSTAVHWLPPLRPLAARHIMKLTGPQDRLLRWRVALGNTGPEAYWKTLVNPNEKSGVHGLAQPANGVFAVDRRSLEDAVGSGGQPAVAYRLGEISMVGVREIKPEKEFLMPVDPQGNPDPEGTMMGVVMRAGGRLDMAIGTSSVNGRHIWPLQTRVLRQVVEVPEGLYRV